MGALINWFFGKRVNSELFSGAVACAAVGVSTVVAFMIAFGIGTPHEGALLAEGGKPVLDQIWTWIQVGDFRGDFGLGMDRLSGIYACFVTFVGLLIHIFATGYMHGDKGYYRFFAFMNLFMFSMLTLVLADNYLLMFVGWEGVGLCSYLLIGFYIDKDEARRAAKKAFVMNRIGDWGVLMAIFLIFTTTGSIAFFDKTVGDEQVMSVFTWVSQNVLTAEGFTGGAIFAGGMTSIAMLLFIGATGKSAQIPLLTWLPDAMAGPTPVSALIHAATMVTAGVYLVVRSSAIFSNAPTALFIVAIIGAATAIFAATIGLAQNDIKKVLAYSTVSQLGFMFLACGVGAYVIAIFHVMTHAFFKALLFLGSGSVIHGMHHEQDMRKMGNLKKYMPVTWVTMMTGWLAIAGIPIFAGFFSKDEILYYTYSATNLPWGWNYVLWVVAAFAAVLTAVYMTRLMVMTFWGKERFHETLPDTERDADDDDDHHQIGPDFKPHESPWTMTVPLVVLALLATFGGLVGIPYALSGGNVDNYFKDTLTPVVAKVKTGHDAKAGEVKHFFAAKKAAAEGEAEAHSEEEIALERGLAAGSVVLAIVGILLGWFLFKDDPMRRLPSLFKNKWYLDQIYNKGIVDPLTLVSRRFLWKGFDLGFIDGTVNGIGNFVVEMGGLARKIQVGFVRSYAAFILLGGILVIGYFVYYGLKLIV